MNVNSVAQMLPAGWQSKRLIEVADIAGRIGWKGLTAKEYTDQGPLFLSVHSLNYGDYVDYRDAFHISQHRYDESPEIVLRTGDVLICKDGAGIGKLGIVGELPGPTTINSSLLLIRHKPCILPKYLYFSLSSPYFQRVVNSRLQGATTPHLYQRDIAEFPVLLPDLKQQQLIVMTLDNAFRQLTSLQANYEKMLAGLKELKQSILQRAFDGALTSDQHEKADAAPQRISTTTASFGAAIIAIAYEQHKTAKRDRSFGHVKAQKLLRLVEAVAGIELGRDPIKDAAGPNDFNHMLRIEDWAKHNEFFEFKKSDGRYHFYRLARYGDCLKAASKEVVQISKELMRIVDLLIPMDTEEAEVLATVYAAWNNMLLDGAPLSDDAIVYAARDDWHLEKLKIPRQRFFEAIKLLRDKDLAPRGTAKQVRRKYLI